MGKEYHIFIDDQLIKIKLSDKFSYYELTTGLKNMIKDYNQYKISYRYQNREYSLKNDSDCKYFLHTNETIIYVYKGNKCPNFKPFYNNTTSQGNQNQTSTMFTEKGNLKSSQIAQNPPSFQVNNQTENYNINHISSTQQKTNQTMQYVSIMAFNSLQKQFNDFVTYQTNFNKQLQERIQLLEKQNVACTNNQHDIQCSNCKIVKIIGTRYKCNKCICYNLCHHCYQKNIKESFHHKLFTIIEDSIEYEREQNEHTSSNQSNYQETSWSENRKNYQDNQYREEKPSEQFTLLPSDKEPTENSSSKNNNHMRSSYNQNLNTSDQDFNNKSNDYMYMNDTPNDTPKPFTQSVLLYEHNNPKFEDINQDKIYRKHSKKANNQSCDNIMATPHDHFITTGQYDYKYDIKYDENYKEISIQYFSSFPKISVVTLPNYSSIVPIKTEVLFKEKVIKLTFDQITKHFLKLAQSKLEYYFQLHPNPEEPLFKDSDQMYKIILNK